MKNNLLVLSTLLGFAACLTLGFVWHKPQPKEEPVATVNWVSIEEAAKLAEKDGKKILVDMYTDWCGWCKRMDKTTYGNPKVVDFINKNYHAVKFNAEQKGSVTVKGNTFKYVASGRRGYNELAAALLQGKLSYPTTTFLSSDFRLIYNVPGYIEADRFRSILQFTHEEAFKGMTFQEYQNSKKGNL